MQQTFISVSLLILSQLIKIAFSNLAIFSVRNYDLLIDSKVTCSDILGKGSFSRMLICPDPLSTERESKKGTGMIKIWITKLV